jgi:hypothetical protein
MAARFRPNYHANGFSNKTFEHEIHRIDGNLYVNCTFVDCTLEFGALALPTFRDCRFRDSDWVFVDAAANMLAFLSLLPKDFGEPGRSLFQQLVQQLEGSRLEPGETTRPISATLHADVAKATAAAHPAMISGTPVENKP